MHRARLILLLVLLTLALPAAVYAQDATPPSDPLAGDGRLFGNPAQATAVPTREAPLGLPTPDVLSILSGTADTPSSPPQNDDTARALLLNAAGEAIGEVAIVPIGGDALVIQVSASGLTPGFHGLHIYETGLCEAETIDGAFSSAGAHLALTDSDHPNHAGDLPPLLVMSSGLAGLAVVTDRLTLDDLYDADGSAFIIHESPDNLAHLPERYGSAHAETLETGDSGARIACAAFVRPESSD